MTQTISSAYFNQQLHRRGTNSNKWDLYAEDVLPMWVADMDFLSPPEVITTLQEKAQHGVFGYPNTSGDLQTKEAIVDWVYQQHQWNITPQDIILIPGVIVGFNLAAKTVTTQGDEIILQPPVYPPFLEVAKNFALHQIDNQMIDTPTGYEIDMDHFKNSMGERTRLFLLCNPHNPTGRVFTQAELNALAEACLANNVFICADEIHNDLIYPGHRHHPIARLAPEIANKTITLMAPSKTFNLAGLAASYAIITNPELRKQFEQAKQGVVGWVNSFGQAALQAAYRHGQPWLTAALAYLDENRQFLMNYLAKELPEVKVHSPEGTYLAWLDMRQGIDTPTPAKYLLEHGRIAVNEGRDFGLGGGGFVRFNFGCPRAQVVEGLRRIRDAVRKEKTT